MACIYTYKGKQYSEQEIKDIVFKEKVKPEDIKFATLDDIANILAYSNSKIILDGWKVEYSTPLGNKYDTLEEVNQEIRGLADADTEIDLSGVKIQEIPDSYEIGGDYTNPPLFFNRKEDKYFKTIRFVNLDNYDPESDLPDKGITSTETTEEINKKEYEETYKKTFNWNYNSFIQKNKEYEQSKEIIEQWKKENNIQYDPEEVYSRGQGFYSSIGAYSNLELDLLLKNLIQHIEDNKKASQIKFDTKEINIKFNDGSWNIIKLNDKRIGQFKFIDNGEKGVLSFSIQIDEDYQNKGYGQITHIMAADLAKKEYGKNLYSDYQNSEQEVQLLKSLAKKGYAEKIGNIGVESKEFKGTYNTTERAYRIKTSDEINNQNSNYGFTISAFTKPIDKRLKHIEGTGDRVRFVIYPKSEHIKWAAPTDVYSGSVWDAHEKVSKDKKSELLGVSFTKAPSLRNINEVSPNLAGIIDNLSHVHNELGLELTIDNFFIEYDESVPYETKLIIDKVNKLLEQKRGGKLVKPEIKKTEIKTVYDVRTKYGLQEKGFNSEKEAREYIDNLNKQYNYSQEDYDDFRIVSRELSGKQPTQTRENTTSIESVKSKLDVEKIEKIHKFIETLEKECN